MSKTKQQIYDCLMEMLEHKIESAQKAIDIVRESRDSDTKSSAGDKYETGRAMMQMELEKNEVQLSRNNQLKKELARINLEKENTQVEFGSLVITTHGNYFISIGIGKIEIDNSTFYAISLASAIGQLLHKKKAGDSFLLHGKEVKIQQIY